MSKNIYDLINKLKGIKTYEERAQINVKEYGIVEKKVKFDYISWATAQVILKSLCVEANWKLENIGDKMVEISIEIEKDKHFHSYPYLDNRNKAIENPNSFDINTAQMRAFAKLFSMITGIGISLYIGEDIPKEPKEPKEKLEEDTSTVAQEEYIFSLRNKLGMEVKVLEELISKQWNKKIELHTLTKRQAISLIAALKEKVFEKDEAYDKETIKEINKW